MSLNSQASDDNAFVRISIDSKAKVKSGKARTIDPPQADDHDEWQTVLVPFGILNTHTHQFAIYMGQSAETSDFIVNCLTDWWTHNRPSYPQLDEWVIDLDGGAATRSRTQFIKRMVAQAIGVTIRLIYYPPYHSKYNPIERCWAVLENYWNGAILDSVKTALNARRIAPIVQWSKPPMKEESKLPEELKQYQPFWQRSEVFMGHHHCSDLAGRLFTCKSLTVKSGKFRKPQSKFLVTLFSTILVVCGKVNFTNLSRYSELNEKTYRRQFIEEVDFAKLNATLIQAAAEPGHQQLAVMDCSFLRKSGKATFGLDRFWNGCNSRVERGLEVSLVGVVEVETEMSYALHAQQPSLNGDGGRESDGSVSGSSHSGTLSTPTHGAVFSRRWGLCEGAVCDGCHAIEVGCD